MKKGLQNLQLPGDLKPSFQGLEVEEEAMGTCPLNTAYSHKGTNNSSDN
jgi:hypothetical protein